MNHGLTKLAWCVDEAYQKKMILDMKRYEFQKHEFSQMLDGVRIMPEEFENESVWFVFELNTGREIWLLYYCNLIVFRGSFTFKLSYVAIDP